MFRRPQLCKTQALPQEARGTDGQSAWTVSETATLRMAPARGTQVLRLGGRVETHAYWVPITFGVCTEAPNICHLI